jgi:hypothetical protein
MSLGGLEFRLHDFVSASGKVPDKLVAALRFHLDALWLAVGHEIPVALKPAASTGLSISSRR